MSSSATFTTGAGIQGEGNFAQEFGQIYKSNVNVNVTDRGAVAGAINAANDAVEKVADFAGTALDYSAVEADRNRAFAGQAAESAINAVKQAGAAVINFSREQSEANRAFAGQAAALVEAAAKRESATAREAIGAVAAGADKALTIVSDTISGALDKTFSLVGGSTQNAIDAIADQSTVNLQFLNEQNKRVADNATATLNGITGFVKDLFNASDERTASLISSAQQQSINSIEVLGEAARSDAAKSLDKLITMAGIAIVVIGGMALFVRAKK